ncbi:GNAT family N-acetyltransferase [Bizionia sediminis]|uniref:GNAT family N-acetyltransferase n=1 Tax=Bizionia sediminis TaxID=1737064 RepID=A0ABW5KT36_9FLAO
MKLQTESFSLEVLQPQDAPSLSRLMISNGKRFQEILPDTLAENLSEAHSKTFIQKKNTLRKLGLEFTFAIKDIDTGHVAGLILIKNINYQTKQAEIAYCLGQKFSGKGWMTRSLKAIKNYAFQNLGLQILQLTIHKSNRSSINIAKSNGFVWMQTLTSEYETQSAVLDMELYQLHYER